MRTTIRTDKAPAPLGSYEQAILVDNTLYLAGQIALDPSSGTFITSDIEKEMYQAMKNLGAVLEEAGMTFDDLVKCTIFLTDIQDGPKVNEVYRTFFKQQLPAREAVQVAGLPKGVNVEISGIAVKA